MPIQLSMTTTTTMTTIQPMIPMTSSKAAPVSTSPQFDLRSRRSYLDRERPILVQVLRVASDPGAGRLRRRSRPPEPARARRVDLNGSAVPPRAVAPSRRCWSIAPGRLGETVVGDAVIEGAECGAACAICVRPPAVATNRWRWPPASARASPRTWNRTRPTAGSATTTFERPIPTADSRSPSTARFHSAYGSGRSGAETGSSTAVRGPPRGGESALGAPRHGMSIRSRVRSRVLPPPGSSAPRGYSSAGMDPNAPSTPGSPPPRAPRSRVLPAVVVIGVVLVVCLVVAAAYFLALGPFQHGSTSPAHGTLPYSQAVSLATNLAGSDGGGPWTVWAGGAIQLTQPYNVNTSALYGWPADGCSPSNPTVYPGANSSMNLPSSTEGPSSGYFSAWDLQLGNASGWVRTVVVLNGTPMVALQVGPSGACSPGAWLPSAEQLGQLLDSPRIVASAWSTYGSQFVAQHPSAHLDLALPSLVGSDTKWSWQVEWSSCPVAIGYHGGGGTAEAIQNGYVNALNGTATAGLVMAVYC
jgi:hypothetical protein